MGCFKHTWTWKEAPGYNAAFRLYTAWTGEGPDTCTTREVVSSRTVLATLKAGTTSYTETWATATGGGAMCSWIQAFNTSGASGFVRFPDGF
jgi:hypothetical protein